MPQHAFQKTLTLLALLLGLWLGMKYLLPLALPFLLGGALALAAEPLTQLCEKRLRLPRGGAAGVGVTAALVMLLALVLILCSAAFRELGVLAQILPDLTQSIRQGTVALQDWLLQLSSAAPEGIQPLLTKSVLRLSDGGTQLLDGALGQLPRVATGILSHMSDGFLLLGTALVSAFLISARLPKLKERLLGFLPESWHSKYLPTLQHLRRSLGRWLGAQLRLAGITFIIVTAGFLLLRITHAPVWALLIALVDAVPLLGTGIVLLPWALVSLLQGDTLRAVGLAALFAAATLTRSVLEPKLVGRQLGLDPLVTLIALYLGYRVWGFVGIIISPLLAVTVMELSSRQQQ